MGWTTYHRPKGESDREHFERELFTGTDYEIVECATVAGVFYAAVRTTTTGEVWALVVLMHRTRGLHNFGYKDLTENMGPVEANAPAKVLDALTSTSNENALEWRRQCEENLTRRADVRKRLRAITPGVVIQIAGPLRFANGREASRFECVERAGRATRWSAIAADGTRFGCRLATGWAERYSWDIVPPNPGSPPPAS
ncbi:MAG TPA: hypothetical protein VFG15_03245 [Amycolatopsis sp.]|nr:hypothetical protein [Amycolatopsis sp.]